MATSSLQTVRHYFPPFIIFVVLIIVAIFNIELWQRPLAHDPMVNKNSASTHSIMSSADYLSTANIPPKNIKTAHSYMAADHQLTALDGLWEVKSINVDSYYESYQEDGSLEQSKRLTGELNFLCVISQSDTDSPSVKCDSQFFNKFVQSETMQRVGDIFSGGVGGIVFEFVDSNTAYAIVR